MINFTVVFVKIKKIDFVSLEVKTVKKINCRLGVLCFFHFHYWIVMVALSPLSSLLILFSKNKSSHTSWADIKISVLTWFLREFQAASHLHLELPTWKVAYCSFFMGLNSVAVNIKISDWHVWHLFCSVTRERWNAGTLASGIEWECWTAPWAASLKEQSK